MSRSILVLSGAGFIGERLARGLQNQGHYLCILSGSIRTVATLADLLRNVPTALCASINRATEIPEQVSEELLLTHLIDNRAGFFAQNGLSNDKTRADLICHPNTSIEEGVRCTWRLDLTSPPKEIVSFSS